jgi:hypothetical protein
VEKAVRREDGREFPVAIVKEHREEFRRKVHAIMYRPVVDLKLPAVRHIMRPVELEPDARRAYDDLAEREMAELGAFATVDPEAGAGEALLSPSNLLARNTRLAQLTGGTLPDDGEPDGNGNRIRTKYRVSRAKADELAEFAGRPDKHGVYTITGGILDEIGCVPGRPGGPEPLVVYCQFRDDLDVVREVAEKAGLRYAEVSGRRSDGLTDRSEMNPQADIVAVQIQSGGTGVDLTRSCYAVWYSVGPSLGDFDQAVAREHRPGQKRAVTNIHLVAVNTVDESIYTTLSTRRNVVGSYLRVHNADPALYAAFGVDPDEEVPTLDEMEAALNSRVAGGMSAGAVVPLPTDEFGADVMGDPRARGPRRKPTPRLTPEQIAEFGLEGIFGDD